MLPPTKKLHSCRGDEAPPPPPLVARAGAAPLRLFQFQISPLSNQDAMGKARKLSLKNSPSTQKGTPLVARELKRELARGATANNQQQEEARARRSKLVRSEQSSQLGSQQASKRTRSAQARANKQAPPEAAIELSSYLSATPKKKMATPVLLPGRVGELN